MVMMETATFAYDKTQNKKDKNHIHSDNYIKWYIKDWKGKQI